MRILLSHVTLHDVMVWCHNRVGLTEPTHHIECYALLVCSLLTRACYYARGYVIASVCQSVSQSIIMQTGRFATLHWTSTMEVNIWIVAAYPFTTDATHIRSNFSQKRFFLWSAILFLYILYCSPVRIYLECSYCRAQTRTTGVKV